MLNIRQAEWDELRRHGEETYPHECCGVLVGEIDGDGKKTVQATIRCLNTRTDSPENRYHIDPRDLLRIQREAAAQGRDIVGFYHSHPDHPPRWSSTDLAEAHWSGCSYLITGVESGRAVETRSFHLTGNEENKRFEDERIQIEERTAA
jgi:proteasome lid subunit RPN8/RPN11